MQDKTRSCSHLTAPCPCYSTDLRRCASLAPINIVEVYSLGSSRGVESLAIEA